VPATPLSGSVSGAGYLCVPLRFSPTTFAGMSGDSIEMPLPSDAALVCPLPVVGQATEILYASG